MEPITSPDDEPSKNENKYIYALAEQKHLQKNNAKCDVKMTSDIQKRVQKYARKYGEELITVIVQEPYIIRKYVNGPKYALEYITRSGQITIYSHPQNTSVKPKMEVYSARYGFISWWHEDDFSDESLGTHVWMGLCRAFSFNPADTSVVASDQVRTDKILKRKK